MKSETIDLVVLIRREANIQPVASTLVRHIVLALMWYAAFPWLEYNKLKQAAFCFQCRVLALNSYSTILLGTTLTHLKASILMDEMTDVSHKEQVATFIRFIFAATNIEERLLALIDTCCHSRRSSTGA
jgi:hypothetical protein